VLDSGEILLPIWYCHGRPGERWVGSHDTRAVRLSADGGRTWQEAEVPESTGCVHMGVEQLADGTLLALFRSRWADSIYESRSSDRGRTWSAPRPTALPNNNSSIQFTRLQNGHLALVFNDISAADSIDRRASLYDDIEDEALQARSPRSIRISLSVPRIPRRRCTSSTACCTVRRTAACRPGSLRVGKP